ncbi:MAG: hypothetical protein R2755_04685 [Acidimicrobiales bacterium]
MDGIDPAEPAARSTVTTELSINPFRDAVERPIGELFEHTARSAGLPELADEDRLPVRRRRTLAIAGACLFVLCVAAVAVEVPRYERRLQQRTAAALGAAGYDGLVVEADGQGVRISGLRSEQDAGAVAELANAVPGVGAVVIVTPADAAGVPYSDPAVPVITATLRAGRLELRGQLPTRSLKDAVLAAAGATVGGSRLIDEIRAARADADDRVTGDVDHFVAVLERLPEDLVAGSVQLEGRTLTLDGLPRASADRAVVDRLLRAAARDGLTVVDRRRD